MSPGRAALGRFAAALPPALARRDALRRSNVTECARAFAGAGDGCPGVYLDVYGPGAVLIINEGSPLDDADIRPAADVALKALAPLGVRAVYAKPFAKDRSKLGGVHPDALRDPQPAAGEPLPESLIVREHDCRYEVRLWDGFSTGLFLDQRENRRELARLVAAHARAQGGRPARVLNTFAYTCGFSVACARAGAEVASVDVSPRYLDWGKRNFTHNGLDPASPACRFARMDTFEFLDYAARKALLFDLIILDPPSFASADKRRGTRAWSSVSDYARLVERAAERLDPRGMRLLFASTNTLELCEGGGPEGGGRLQREIIKGLARPPEQWLALPPAPPDFAPEPGRFAARLCRV